MNHKRLKDNPKDRALSKKASKAFEIPLHKNPSNFVLAFFPWRENAPMALPLGGWKKWKDEMAEKYPVRFFFFNIVPNSVSDFFRYNVTKPLHDVKWAILHRFHPKHQYNILKPRSLKPGYYDSDTRILHACMDELSEFVEWNERNDWIDWGGDDKHKIAWTEMKTIYRWWNKDRAKMEEEADRAIRKWHDVYTKEGGFDRTKNLSKRANRLSDEHQRLEDLIVATDEDMLVRLMKIRRFLWT